MCTVGRICNRCTDFVVTTTAPNAKCQRVLVLAPCLVTIVVIVIIFIIIIIIIVVFVIVIVIYPQWVDHFGLVWS